LKFFEEKQKNDNTGDGGLNLEKYCTVFIAYFDEVRGHQLMFIHPEFLEKDQDFIQEESKIIFIHSIWWMNMDVQAELSHVDLEFNGRNYLAKKFNVPSTRKKSRSGMDEDTPETIVIFLSVPIILNPIAGNLLNKLHMNLYNKFKNDFSVAIEKTICESKIIKSPKDKEVCQKGSQIINKMRACITRTLKDFQVEFQLTFNDEDQKQKALAYLLYQDIKRKPSHPTSDKDVFFEKQTKITKADFFRNHKEKIRLEKAILFKDENKVNLTLVNVTNDVLQNCVVSIAFVENFFEKYFFEQPISLWFENEELNFQFESIFPVDLKRKAQYVVTVMQDDKEIFHEVINTSKLEIV